MGLFSVGVALEGAGGVSKELLHRHECRVCPLNNVNLHNPKMLATGAETPIVYILGEVPNATEDIEGTQFAGKTGQLLRASIPKGWNKHIRWQNIIRCHFNRDDNSDATAIEACRPSIIRDIEASKPKFIFAFGNTPLRWLLGQAGIQNWRGRYAPVKVGKHSCWAFFFLHPSYIKQKGGRESEEERVFQFDLNNAFVRVEKWTSGKSNIDYTPYVHSRADSQSNITYLTGHESEAFRQVLDFLEYASKQASCGVDYENYPLKPYNNGIIISAAVSVYPKTLAFGLDHPEAGWSPEQRKTIEKAWVKFLKSPVRKISHNAQHELLWSAYFWGKEAAGVWEDTVTQAFVLDERSGIQVGGPLSLGFLVLQYFGINIKYLSNLDKKDLRNEPLPEVLLYNGTDAKYHEALYWAQHFRLRDEGLEAQYQDMLQRVRSCALTQLKGIPLDLEENKRQGIELRTKLDVLAAEIAATSEAKQFQRRFHKTFEPGSPSKVALMCSMLGFDTHSEKDRKEHTDENALNQIDHPIAKAVVAYRKLVKLNSTYVASVADSVYQDGLLHHNLNTVFVHTSRSSADSPNMQNFVKHQAEGKKVRKQIIPPKGYAIWSSDFAQIQARNIAMESKDPTFCKMLWERYDVHGEWAQRLGHAWPDLVGGKKNLKDVAIMKEFRNKIKSGWTFALFFGSRLDNIINNHLHAPRNILQPLYEDWWETFSGIHDWQQRLIKTYKEQGYVENLTGIRRRAPLSENQIVNSPIQADEAAIVFDSFNRLSALEDWNLQPVMEIHDDLQFFFPLDKEEVYAEKVVDELLRITFPWINVPLGIELARSETTWYDMAPCGEYWSDQWYGEPKRPSYAR